MILAPMQGLTEVLFRRVYEECFPGALEYAVAPFISLTHNLLQSPKELAHNGKLTDVLPDVNRGSIPVVPQILGKEPEEFVAVANCLYEMGYREVNWNIGCPMRQVTAKHRGSGILPHPDEMRAILLAVVPRLKPLLSVKMRLGLKEPTEIFNLIPILNEFPLASVTIHPRLGRQQYTGVPDLDTFALALEKIQHPVIYNGDIRTPDDARRIMTRFPKVSNLMVGRGILYNPTLPLSSLLSPPPSLNYHFICRLMETIDQTYVNEESRIRKKKEYWCLLWKSLPISEMEARTVLRAKLLTDVDKMISDFLQ